MQQGCGRHRKNNDAFAVPKQTGKFGFGIRLALLHD
jgi:hypothetical protein